MTTKTDNALELAQWLGTGQALLARLQELFGELWRVADVVSLEGQPFAVSPENYSFVGQLIREAVEHFGEMP